MTDTHLVTFYDGLHARLVVQIRNWHTFIEGFWTDEMEMNTRRNDLTEAKRMFLLTLCQQWYDLTGEKLEPVKPGPEYEWTVGEVKHAEGESL